MTSKLTVVHQIMNQYQVRLSNMNSPSFLSYKYKRSFVSLSSFHLSERGILNKFPGRWLEASLGNTALMTVQFLRTKKLSGITQGLQSIQHSKITLLGFRLHPYHLRAERQCMSQCLGLCLLLCIMMERKDSHS